MNFETNEPGKSDTDSISSDLQSPASVPQRTATGPRTPEGKERSKRNATKHAIFSRVVVLKGESSEEYEELLNGLREAFQPRETDEDILVEILATTVWRRRRVLIAEGAEIQMQTQFLEWDQRTQQRLEAEKVGTRIEKPSLTLEDRSETSEPGLISSIGNSEVLSRCIELLVRVRQVFEREGFDSDECDAILKRIYGDNTHLRETLKDRYSSWSEAPETKSADRKALMFTEIDAEMKRLKEAREVQLSIASDRIKLERLRRSVPDSPSLDRLLRYEASLDRTIDRTLSQLERLQRMRKGQPVPPEIQLKVSA